MSEATTDLGVFEETEIPDVPRVSHLSHHGSRIAFCGRKVKPRTGDKLRAANALLCVECVDLANRILPGWHTP